MPSNIFKSLLNAEIEQFKSYFSNTSQELFFDQETQKLIHTGEFGVYREKTVFPFLRMIMPQRLSINTGFLITPKDNVSTQCDIVIYDAKSSPLIQDDDRQTFYPIETVTGIGEIKSTLKKIELKSAINKLAKIKKLRSDISDLEPSITKRTHPGKINLDQYPYDHIFSFLICEKLNFNIANLNFDDLYEDEIDQKFKHNMILSIKDGLFLYHDGKMWHYPIASPSKQKINNTFWLQPDESNPLNHFHIFSHYFFMGIDSATIFYPEFRHYLD